MSDSKIKDFVRSDEACDLLLDFDDRFDCWIAFHETGDDLFFEVDGGAYFIPDDFDVEAFKSLISRSFQEERNLIYDTFKENVFKTIPGAEY